MNSTLLADGRTYPLKTRREFLYATRDVYVCVCVHDCLIYDQRLWQLHVEFVCNTRLLIYGLSFFFFFIAAPVRTLERNRCMYVCIYICIIRSRERNERDSTARTSAEIKKQRTNGIRTYARKRLKNELYIILSCTLIILRGIEARFRKSLDSLINYIVLVLAK